MDSKWLAQPLHPAGYYLRRYKQHPSFASDFDRCIGKQGHHLPPKITLTRASDRVTEVHMAIEGLSAKVKQKAHHRPGQFGIVCTGSSSVACLLEQCAKKQLPVHCRLNYPCLLYTSDAADD